MPKVLIVDDDAFLLAAMHRQFRRHFDLTTAETGALAIDFVKNSGPFAVVVCDMQMPNLNGIETLRAIQDISPNTVRLMLTGNADQQTATDAVNKGNIFRFFTKPCDTSVLELGIKAGIRQYELITAEREILENTLAGSVKVLVDVLEVVDPVSFCRANKLRRWCTELAPKLSLSHPWELFLAATLSQLGNITIPSELIIKMNDGDDLSHIQRDIVDSAPEMAKTLISNIPRLARVSEIVALQNRGFDGSGTPTDGPIGDAIPIEGRILKILVDLDRASEGAAPSPAAFKLLANNRNKYDPTILKIVQDTLEMLPQKGKKTEKRLEVPVNMLHVDDLLVDSLELLNGRLILEKGYRLSKIQVQKIKNLAKIHDFIEPVKIKRMLL